MSWNRGVIVTLALLAGLCTSATRAAASGEPARAQQREGIEEAFLGFSPGEEIRYELERADGQRRGMRTTWSMRLEEVDPESGLGVFALTYEMGGFRRSTGSAQGQPGAAMSRTTATAWISPYGFPTRVKFTTQRTTPMGGLEYTIEYRYENERFIKELEGSDKDQKTKLDGYRDIDLDIPAGVYLFMPIAAECVGSARPARGYSGGGGGRGGGGGGGAGGRRGAGRNRGSAWKAGRGMRVCHGRRSVRG